MFFHSVWHWVLNLLRSLFHLLKSRQHPQAHAVPVGKRPMLIVSTPIGMGEITSTSGAGKL